MGEVVDQIFQEWTSLLWQECPGSSILLRESGQPSPGSGYLSDPLGERPALCLLPDFSHREDALERQAEKGSMILISLLASSAMVPITATALAEG